MKVYLFNADNGLYEGETFEETATLGHEDGLTTIAPPEFEPGQVPVFDCQKKTWSVIPVTIAQQLLKISAADTTGRRS